MSERRRPAQPPRAALLLLRRGLDRDAFEIIVGDLEEEFQSLAVERGRWAARRWFWRQTVTSLWSRRRAHAVPRSNESRRGGVFVEQRLGDLRLACRQLIRAPAFAAVAILALGIGIGLTTTTFSIVRGSLLRGLPFDQAHELVHFERQNRELDQLTLAVTPHDYAAWRAAQTTFVDLGAYTDVLVVIGGESVAAESSLAIRINTTALDLLGVSPARGRGFSPEDEVPGAAPVILIGDEYWRTRLGGDPEVLGSTLRIDGIPTTVVGIMPPGFGFPVEEQLWLPLQLDFSRIDRGTGRLDAFGRLLPGYGIEAARVEFERISDNLQRAYPATNAGITASLQTFEDEYIGADFAATMLAMLVGAFLVLGIACANVANLLTSRGCGRAREIAVRTAIGAGRGRLFAQLITETMVLATAGGALGLAIAYLGVAAFRVAWSRGVPLGLPHGLSNGLFWWQFEIDTSVLVFVFGITVLTTTVAGLVPALRASGSAAGLAVRTSGGGGAGGRRSGRLLVAAQFALTAGLVTTAGLMVKSVYMTSTIDDGIAAEGVFTSQVQLLAAAGALPENYPDVESRLLFWQRLDDRLIAGRRVDAVGFTSSLPMTRAGSAEVRIDGELDGQIHQPSAVIVSPGFFEVFDVEPVQGRLFDDTDRRGGPDVIVVNQAFAQLFQPEGIVGRRIRLGSDGAETTEPWLTVVGVVPDMWVDAERHEPAIYMPLAQIEPSPARRGVDRWGGRRLYAVTRSLEAGEATDPGVRELVAGMDPYVPVGAQRPMPEVAAGLTAQYQVYGLFYIAFGCVSLIMATIGLYSVVAQSVGNRTAEIGIRMAVGADARGILRMVLAQGAAHITFGLAAGFALAVWLPFQVTRILFEVEPWDPSVVFPVLALLFAIGVAACWAPARRAAAVDPIEAIRAD